MGMDETLPPAPPIPDSVDDSRTISGRELEQLTGLTERRLRDLAKEGFMPAPKVGKWMYVASVRGVIKHYQALAVKKSESLAAEELKKLTAERKQAEYKLLRIRKEVIPASSVYATWANIVVTVVRILRAAVSKLDGALKVCTTHEERIEAIRKELEHVCKTMSQEATYTFAKEAEEDPFDEEAEADEPKH